MYPKQKKIPYSRFGLLVGAFILLCILPKMQLRAQAIISYPISAQSLTRALDTSLLTVKVDFASSCTGITAELRFPSGVDYVPGSVTATASSGGLTITDLGGTTSKPTFTISDAATSNNITFTVKRVANCGSASSGKDSVYITGSCGTTTETVGSVNNYNVFSPSISLTAPTTITGANLGSSYSRTFSITNGGNGCLDTLRLCIIRPSGSVSAATLKVGAATITPSSTSGDTSFYKISGANLPGGTAAGKMCNGETVTFTENFTLVNCLGLITTYIGSWGRDHLNPCQSVSGSAIINMNTGVPNLALSLSAPALTGCRISRPVTITVTNTGSAPASSISTIFGQVYNAILVNWNANFIDTSSIILALPSVASYHPSGLHIDGTVGDPSLGIGYSPAYIPACAAGKVASLDFNLPDGFVLGVSQSYTITFNLMNCAGGSCSDNGYNDQFFSAGLSYKDQCGSTNYSYPFTDNLNGGVYQFQSVVPQIPAQIPVGQCFDYKIDVAIYTDGTYSTGYEDYVLNLPPGISFNTVTELSGMTPLPGYPKVVGSQVTLRLSPSRNQSVKFNLCTSAGACGMSSISASVSSAIDSSCTTPMVIKQCFSNTVNVVCIAPCPSGGVIPYDWKYNRITYGQPDNDNDGLPDATGTVDTTKIDRDRYRPGDVLHSRYYGTVLANTIVPYSSWNYVFAEWSFAMGTWTPSGTATVVIKRSSTGTTYTVSGITVNTLTAGKAFQADWSGSASLPGGFTYLPGDSLFIQTDFKLISNVNAGPNYSTIDEAGYNSSAVGIAALTETVYAAQVASPSATTGYTGPDRFTCFIPQYNANLIGLNHSVGLNGVNANGASGCADLQTYGGVYTTQLSSNNGGRYFSYEYRPVVIADTIIFDIPAGWEFVSGTGSVLYYTTSPGGFGTPFYSIIPAVSAYAGGTRLIYDVKAALASGALPHWSTEAMAYFIYPNLRASCSTPPTATYWQKEYAHYADYPNTTAPLHFVDSSANTLYYNAGAKPSITLQNNTGVVQGVQTQQYWDVQINNPSLTTAPYIWMAVEKGSSGITIDSVVLKPSNVILSPSSYGTGNKWYQVSTAGIGSGANQQARIYFKYNSCTLDSIQMKAGWNCSGYPSPDPTAYSCFVTSQYLKVNPLPSQIQLSIANQPAVPSKTLCTQDSITVVVNSAQSANLINPQVTIVPPTGVTVDLPLQIEYPLGSGIWQNASTVLSGGNYIVNLNDHTGIGTYGLPGTILSASSANRQAKIRVPYTTGCSFVSGSLIGVVSNAGTPCGGTAIGNGNAISSNAVNVTGATTTGGMGLTFSFGSTSLNCSTGTTLSLTSTPVIAPTQAGDTITYTLPQGLGYAGSFAGGTNCASCSASSLSGPIGTTLVKVKLQTGVAAGSAMNFSFDVVPIAGSCGNVTISATAQRAIPALMCGSTTCTSSSAVFGSATSGPITLNKPSLTLTNLATDSAHWVAGQNQNVYIKYNNNNGAQAYTANTDSVEFFCGSSTTPFAVRPLTKNLAISANDSDTYSIFIPKTACTVGDLVTAKIQTTTSAGTAQCLCNPSSLMLAGVPLPLDFVSVNAQSSSCAVHISWNYGNNTVAHYAIERSNNARIYNEVATLDPKATSYIDVTPESGSWYYRIKAINIDGTNTYSPTLAAQTTQCIGNTVNIYPNPAQDQLQIVLQGSSMTDNYELVDALGRVVMKGSLKSNANNKVDVSHVSQGVYVLRVIMDESVTTQQVQIRR